MNTLPSIFVSHGAPDLPLQSGAAVDFFRSIHLQFPQPQAILVISAHWHSRLPTVSTTQQPKTHHDFSGFPSQLYQLEYPAPGAPELAERVINLLAAAGINGNRDSQRGFDHGAWVPLLLMYPAANIPTLQLSIQSDRAELYHWQLGQALAPLRAEGVLIIGSGGATHNLYEIDMAAASPPIWVEKFDRWLAETIQRQDWQALLHYREIAPYARENHPSTEHLLPLFVAVGAAGANPYGKQIHSSYTYGSLSMAAYAFS